MKKSINEFNEEQIKNQVIVPFLKKIGAVEDLYFETHFKIFVTNGKNNEIQGETKGIYSDVIIGGTVEGVEHGLVLLEIKRPKHKIVKKDIEQGICYARLCERVVPYVIVTNGNETKVFDTLTSKEINEVEMSSTSFIKNNYKISIDEDIKAEANKIFLSLNPENFTEFCIWNSEKNMRDIHSSTDYTKTINSKLNLDRDIYIKEFDNFIESNQRVFGVIGKSGCGKTNYLYSIWNKRKNMDPCLFYNLALLNGSFEESFSRDFSFLLNKKQNFSELLGRIEKILESHNKLLFIILDGIDESPDSNNLITEINDLLKNTGTRIKIILSCKIANDSSDSLWDKVIYYKNHKNIIGDLLYTDEFNDCSVKIEELNETEVGLFWERYKNIYNVEGSYDTRLLNKIKNPLFMRLISELYSNKSVDDDILSIDLFEKWYEMKVNEITGSNDIINHQIGLISNEIIERGNYIRKKDLLKKDSFLNNWEIIEFALRAGLLSLSRDAKNNEYIGFPYDEILNYVYLFEYEDLGKLNIVEITLKFNDWLKKYGKSRIYLITNFMALLNASVEEENGVWSEIYKVKEKLICPICKMNIAEDDNTTILWQFMLSAASKNSDFGKFEVCHKECCKQGNSVLKIFPRGKEDIVTMNMLDFVSAYRSLSLISIIAEQRAEFEADIKSAVIGYVDNESKEIGYYFHIEMKKNIGCVIFKNTSQANKYLKKNIGNLVKRDNQGNTYMPKVKRLTIDILKEIHDKFEYSAVCRSVNSEEFIMKRHVTK